MLQEIKDRQVQKYAIPGFPKCAWKISGALTEQEVIDARYYCLNRSRMGMIGRSESPSKREYIVNSELSLFVAYKTLPLVSQLIDQPLRVLHTFTSIYDAGDVLEPHLDRAPLDWTLSISLGDDSTPEGLREMLSLGALSEPIQLSGDVGDAVLFAGRVTPHWRVSACPRRLITMLIHFSPMSGEK